MISKFKTLTLLSCLVGNSVIASSIYFLDATDKDVGNVTISNGKPVSSNGHNFESYTKLDNQPFTGNKTIMIKNGKVGTITASEWDFTAVGNVTQTAWPNCKNINIGSKGGSLSN